MTEHYLYSGREAAVTPIPLAGVIFYGLGELKPKDDITALESVHIGVMLAYAAKASHYADYKAYAEKHGLTRHFHG